MNGPPPIVRPIVHVVDDDPSIRRAVVRLLRAVGYEAREYASVAELLATAPGRSPGCVLADLQMPGQSGLDLLASPGEAGDYLPVIFLTAHGDIPTSVRAMQGGAVDFLAKPVTKDDLLPAIERALARDAAEREGRAEGALGMAIG